MLFVRRREHAAPSSTALDCLRVTRGEGLESHASHFRPPNGRRLPRLHPHPLKRPDGPGALAAVRTLEWSGSE